MIKQLDSLDPITEIIKSGQASSYSIALERILWVMMGLFFLGAIFTSISRGINKNHFLNHKSFFSPLRAAKGGEKKLPEKEK